MVESLLTTSSVKLYGRVLKDLQFNPPAGVYANTPNANQFLQEQLTTNSPNFARIYAFSYEGSFYNLPKPTIFLVHGAGAAVAVATPPGRSTTDVAGVVAKEWEFSALANGGAADLVFWEYERNDILLRLDTESGPLDQILLQFALRGGGSGAGVSGAGVSGAGVSGAGVSGAGVSGAGVSGAGVSGAGVSGAGVSGAGLRR